MNSKQLRAFCFRSGLLQVAECVPEGALELALAPATVLVAAIEATARLAYDNATWLVPGVPEAPDEKKACDAVFDYQTMLNQRLSRLLASQGGDDVSCSPRI